MGSMVAPMGLIKKSPTSILIIPFVINMFIKWRSFDMMIFFNAWIIVTLIAMRSLIEPHQNTFMTFRLNSFCNNLRMYINAQHSKEMWANFGLLSEYIYFKMLPFLCSWGGKQLKR